MSALCGVLGSGSCTTRRRGDDDSGDSGAPGAVERGGDGAGESARATGGEAGEGVDGGLSSAGGARGGTHGAAGGTGGVGGTSSTLGGAGDTSGETAGGGSGRGGAFGGAPSSAGGSTAGGVGGDGGRGGSPAGGGSGTAGAGAAGAAGTSACEDAVVFYDEDAAAGTSDTVLLPNPPFPPYTYATLSTFGDGTATPGGGLENTTHPGGGVYSSICSGAGFTDTGGGCRVTVAQDLTPYGFTGVEFWARAYEPVNVRVNLTDPAAIYGAGSSCDNAPGCTQNCCGDYYGADFTFDTTWRLYSIQFSDLAREHGTGPDVPFDPSHFGSIYFRGPLVEQFLFYLDDLAFIACP